VEGRGLRALSARRGPDDRARGGGGGSHPPWGAVECVQVSAGAEGEGTGLELRAFDATSGEEIDRSHAEHAVSVRACAEPVAARGVRFELRTTSGKLDAVVGERTR